MSKADASEETTTSSKVLKGDEDEECKTPILSEEQKIPAVQSCPPAPAPKKRDRVVLAGRKRKGTQLQFFEDGVGSKEEVDSFFQSTANIDIPTAVAATGSSNSSSVVPQSTTTTTTSSSTTTTRKRRKKSRK